MSDRPRDARWLEAEPDLPNELSELLRAGREPLGGAGEVAELARRLSAVLGPAAGLTGGGQPAAPEAAANPRATGGAAPSLRAPSAPAAGGAAAPGAASRTWVLAGIGAAVTIGVAAFVLLRGPSGPVDAPAPSGSLTPSGVVEAAPAAPAEPARTAPPAASSAAPPAPADDDVERGTGGAAERAPRAVAPRSLARAAAARRARADGARETALLEQARAALQSRPAEALALTRRHQARFPRGALAQEREVIAIEALERLGRKAAADARAAEFDRRYRGSVHQPRLLRGSDTSVPGGGASSTRVP